MNLNNRIEIIMGVQFSWLSRKYKGIVSSGFKEMLMLLMILIVLFIKYGVIYAIMNTIF